MVSVDKCIFICSFFLMFIIIPVRINKKHQNEFDKYLLAFNKSYLTKEEYMKHFTAYKDSLLSIDQMNSFRKNNNSAKYGLTSNTDLTIEDFNQKYLHPDLFKSIVERMNNKYNIYLQNWNLNNFVRLPLRVDWRKYGIITEVNNQKLCGACWAFTVIENIEAMYALKFGNLTKLSVQEMIDCAKYNDGCNGGDMCRLLRWLKESNISIQQNIEYPLTLENGKCKLSSTSEGVKISSFICRNYERNENKILSLIANHGPVIAAVNALSWKNYLGGVIQYHCSDSPYLLNHAVQIVGYDLSAEVPHYIVRNSWGTGFGDGGYLYISIGNNTCGIANEVIALNIA